MPPPRIYCDFNGGVAADTYGLNCKGTLDDVRAAGVTLAPGLNIVVYDEDVDDDGTPTLMLADAVVVEVPGWGLCAKCVSPFRRERGDPTQRDR